MCRVAILCDRRLGRWPLLRVLQDSRYQSQEMAERLKLNRDKTCFSAFLACLTTEYGQTQTAIQNIIFVKNKYFNCKANLLFFGKKNCIKCVYDIFYIFSLIHKFLHFLNNILLQCTMNKVYKMQHICFSKDQSESILFVSSVNENNHTNLFSNVVSSVV